MACNCSDLVSRISETSTISEFKSTQQAVLDCSSDHSDLNERLTRILCNKATMSFVRGEFKEYLMQYLAGISTSEINLTVSSQESTVLMVSKNFQIMISHFTDKWNVLPKGIEIEESKECVFPDIFLDDQRLRSLLPNLEHKISFRSQGNKLFAFAHPSSDFGYAVMIRSKNQLIKGSAFMVNDLLLIVSVKNTQTCEILVNRTKTITIPKGQELYIYEGQEFDSEFREDAWGRISFATTCVIEPIKSEIFRYMHSIDEITQRKPSKQIALAGMDMISYPNLYMKIIKP